MERVQVAADRIIAFVDATKSAANHAVQVCESGEAGRTAHWLHAAVFVVEACWW
jgi:hypothetical protein